jgi:hypothetical protein
MLAILEASGTGSGLKTSASAMLKIAEFAPIARAIETIAVIANPGFCRSARME